MDTTTLSEEKNGPGQATQLCESAKQCDGPAVHPASQADRERCLISFDAWPEEVQTQFVEALLSRMSHCQHSRISTFLRPMLQRDFISLLPKKGLDHVAEAILSYLDARSLCAAEAVCR